MSFYNLIRASSKIQRSDAISDLHTLNNWRLSKGLKEISSIGPSIKQIENATALGMENLNTNDLPKLHRGKQFYESIISEISQKDRKRFEKVNPNLH